MVEVGRSFRVIEIGGLLHGKGGRSHRRSPCPRGDGGPRPVHRRTKDLYNRRGRSDSQRGGTRGREVQGRTDSTTLVVEIPFKYE